MRISATQRKSGDWRSAAMEPLGDVLHSEGEALGISDTRWLGIGTSRLDVPGNAAAKPGTAWHGNGMAK